MLPRTHGFFWGSVFLMGAAFVVHCGVYHQNGALPWEVFEWGVWLASLIPLVAATILSFSSALRVRQAEPTTSDSTVVEVRTS